MALLGRITPVIHGLLDADSSHRVIWRRKDARDRGRYSLAVGETTVRITCSRLRVCDAIAVETTFLLGIELYSSPWTHPAAPLYHPLTEKRNRSDPVSSIDDHGSPTPLSINSQRWLRLLRTPYRNWSQSYIAHRPPAYPI